MDKDVKSIMLNLYPKRASSRPENDNEPEKQDFVHPIIIKENEESSNISKKWFFSAIIAGISIFLFSSFFLDVIDDVCMRRDTTVFNSRGDPKPLLIIVIFTIILLISRTFFSLI